MYVDTEVTVNQPIIKYGHPDIQNVLLFKNYKPGVVVGMHVLKHKKHTVMPVKQKKINKMHKK